MVINAVDFILALFSFLSWTQKVHVHEDWGDELDQKPRDLGSGPERSLPTTPDSVLAGHLSYLQFLSSKESIVQMITASEKRRVSLYSC